MSVHIAPASEEDSRVIATALEGGICPWPGYQMIALTGKPWVYVLSQQVADELLAALYGGHPGGAFRVQVVESDTDTDSGPVAEHSAGEPSPEPEPEPAGEPEPVPVAQPVVNVVFEAPAPAVEPVAASAEKKPPSRRRGGRAASREPTPDTR